MASPELVDIHKIVRNPNRWSCLPCSMAMALGTSLEFILGGLGHDGSQIKAKAHNVDSGRRGFDIQELAYLALRLGYATVTWERQHMRDLPCGDFFCYPDSETHFLERLALPSGRGIVGGIGRISGNYHAIAKAGDSFLDPNGGVYFSPESALVHPVIYWEFLSLKLK